MDRKTKFSLSFKEALVKELLSGTVGSQELSLKYGISDRYLRRLAQRYEDEGSLVQPRRTAYTKAFKLACVLAVRENQISLSEAATSFGIPTDSTLVQWIKRYEEFGADGLEATKVGRPKKMSGPSKNSKKKSSAPVASALQEELEYLRAENAYLKKLNALIQQEKLKSNGAKSKPSKN